MLTVKFTKTNFLFIYIYAGSSYTKLNLDVLKEEDDNGDVICVWCTPGDKPWEAICCICNDTIKCSQHGIFSIKRYAKNNTHIENWKKKKNRKEMGH